MGPISVVAPGELWRNCAVERAAGKSHSTSPSARAKCAFRVMRKIRVLRGAHPGTVACDTALSRVLLDAVGRGEFPECLRVWWPRDALAFSVLDRRREGFESAVRLARNAGFEPFLRLTGGHAAVYTAIIDEDRRDFLLIMEDVVARGADPRDSTRPMSVDQAAAGVRGLARLHSGFWGGRLTGNPALQWVEPFVAFEGLEYAPLHIAHERLGDTAPAEVTALNGTELFVDIWARYIGSLTASTPTAARAWRAASGREARSSEPPVATLVGHLHGPPL